VTDELVAYLRTRDGGCVLAKVDPDHSCRDQWGTPHPWNDVRRLSVEHVKDQPRLGRRAPSDRAHTLLLCHGANVGVPSKTQRIAFREYLRVVEGVAA
jgi:hypothetical protein